MSKFAIYQVLVRLFGNRNTHPKINGNIEENGCGKLNYFTSEVLQEIRELGITHIWFTGIIRHATTTVYPSIPSNNVSIVKGKAGSPYAITDYFDIHPDLAENVSNRMHEFEQLVERTHSHNLKVLIDFVPNHLSREYKSLQKPHESEDFGESDFINEFFNPQNNFYYFPEKALTLPFSSDYIEFPAKVSGNDVFNAYPQEFDWYETIKLNYGVNYQNGNSKHFYPIPKTWKMMKEVLLFWVSKNIDGFRCDMVKMVPVEFWEWVIPKIKQINPDIIFIAETYNPEAYDSYITKGGFDYLYDKVDFYDTIRSIVEGNQKVSLLSNVWKSLNGKDKKMLRFLENHDEQRLASRFFANNPQKGIPPFFIAACMHQNPILIYFGQEFGETADGNCGFSGDDGRTTIFDYWKVPSIQNWLNANLQIQNLSEETQCLYSHYQRIINFSLNEKAITEGDFYDLMWINKDNLSYDSVNIFAFLRIANDSRYLCLSNFSDKKISIKALISEHAFEFCKIRNYKLLDFSFVDYFSNNILKISGMDCKNSGIPIILPAFSYAAYRF